MCAADLNTNHKLTARTKRQRSESSADFCYALKLNQGAEIEIMTEQAIENEINEKGLNAPRITPDHIDATIADEDYHVFEKTCLTVCCLTLQNGFTVTGESACASPENFDAEIGRKIARENARNKIWALEGYLLKQKLVA